MIVNAVHLTATMFEIIGPFVEEAGLGVGVLASANIGIARIDATAKP